MNATLSMDNLLIIVFFYLVVINLLTFLLYGFDKRAAKKGHWRISEMSLHFFALASGWLGAICGQKLFRHKTRKQPFRAIFFLTIFINIALCYGAYYLLA